MTLLAKTSNAGITLVDHTRSVVQAARRIVDVCGPPSLHAAGMDPSSLPVLRRMTVAAACMHDIFKALEQFQFYLRGRDTGPASVLHDALLAWILRIPALRAWLRLDDDPVNLAALAAACGHHRRVTDYTVRTSGRVRIRTDDPDWNCLMDYIRRQMGLGPVPTVDAPLSIDVQHRHIPEFQEHFCDAFERDVEQKLLLALARMLLIAADVAASADPDLVHLDGMLSAGDPGRYVRQIIAAETGAKNITPRPFQRRMQDASGPVTLVDAGCGTGKSLGAYLWASTQYPARPLLFTLPTTGQASAAFETVASRYGVDVDVEHSRRLVDLRRMGLGIPAEIESLHVWGQGVVYATVDTVLGVMTHARRATYAWPTICRSTVVFDEIQSYSERMFRYLLTFLETFPGIPCMMLSGGLPSTRRQAIDRVARRVHGAPLAVVGTDPEFSSQPRYRFVHGSALDHVDRHLGTGGRVLWIRNRVGWAQQTWDRLRQMGLDPCLVHGRYKNRDRITRQNDAIQAFDGAGALVVGTQVLESSLDLSATLLITDIADIASLVQRLGRGGRRAGEIADVLVQDVSDEDALPYNSEYLRQARRWLQDLGDGPCSQSDLIRAWVDMGHVPDPYPRLPWVDGIYDVAPSSVRESGYTVPVIMESDQHDRQSYLINMPRNCSLLGVYDRGVYVVPDQHITYDPYRGAEWAIQSH